MGFDMLLALYWDFWQIPYFKVFETKGNKVVKVFNQKVVNSQKGSSIALIDKPNKICWWITDDYFIQKARFIFYVDVNNAIPLQIEEKREITGNLILKEKIRRGIKVDEKKQKEDKKNGLPSKKVEINFPPIILYQLIEAHFVEETMSEPPSKWAELKWVLIAGIIVMGFLLYNLMGSGLIGGR